MSESLPERVWYGDAPWERVARGLLAPAGWVYAGIMSIRNVLYDAGALSSGAAALPTLSIGNLTVGGTGKTPMAAWAVHRLLAAGARPAIVLRGYGDDETQVHARLNPEAIVIPDADRLRGVAQARALGADCAILDDAFQHRRIRRDADWLLIAAERWRAGMRCLPAGPLRESAASASRASMVIVTRKTASRDDAEALAARLSERVVVGATAVVHLAPDGLVDAHSGALLPLSWLQGRTVAGVAAVGEPSAFFAQLRAEGTRVHELPFRDHHRFDARDVARIVGLSPDVTAVVCTLKDAVKLAPLWPRAGPVLWYVSQRIVVERGAAVLDDSLANFLTARASVTQTAGPAGPSFPAHGHRSSTADQ